MSKNNVEPKPEWEYGNIAGVNNIMNYWYFPSLTASAIGCALQEGSACRKQG